MFSLLALIPVFFFGIEAGVSELNPELTEELARLRRANEQLIAKVCIPTAVFTPLTVFVVVVVAADDDDAKSKY